VRALVRQARDGDERAFRRLVETHMRSVYALAHRLMRNHDDADDVAQETFVRAHRALDRYDESFSFYTWLRTIATRVALNELAKRRRRRTEGGETFEAAADGVASEAPGPEALFAERELGSRLEAALASLPDEYRTAIVLRVHEGLSYQEIARELDVPIGTVMSRLSRARTTLRRALQAQRGAPAEQEGRA
jgi:RNA polymerase sigma-70 factor (ECF subfamily)